MSCSQLKVRVFSLTGHTYPTSTLMKLKVNTSKRYIGKFEKPVSADVSDELVNSFGIVTASLRVEPQVLCPSTQLARWMFYFLFLKKSQSVSLGPVTIRTYQKLCHK